MDTMTHEGDLDLPCRLLSIPEVAAQLGCSRPHVYRLIDQGQLTAVDISSAGATRTKTRVRVDHLTNYIEHGTWAAPGSS